MISLERRIRAVVPSGPRIYQPMLWVGVALPIFIVEGFFNLLTNVDIIIVGHFMEPDKVAVYFAAVKTLALVHFVYFAVRAGGAQRFSQYYVSGDRARLAAFTRDTLHWTILALAGDGDPALYYRPPAPPPFRARVRQRLSTPLCAVDRPAHARFDRAGGKPAHHGRPAGHLLADLYRDLPGQRRLEPPAHPEARADGRGDRDLDGAHHRDDRALHRHRHPPRHPLLHRDSALADRPRPRGQA